MLLVENLFVILARESKRREVLDDSSIFVDMRLIVTTDKRYTFHKFEPSKSDLTAINLHATWPYERPDPGWAINLHRRGIAAPTQAIS